MQSRICFVSVDAEGVINENLNKILDILGKYNVSATLFVVGEVLKKNSDLFKELQNDYEIACHGFTHRFWNTLNRQAREKELDDFIDLYQRVFSKNPLGFRAPSHLIDNDAIELLEEKGFLYDSSVVPHYPPFKKYRGYKNKAPLLPHFPENRKILEIPVRGQILGIPLAGAWMAKLPHFLYKILFSVYCPEFITLNIHSWDTSDNLERIIRILKNKNYQFLNGEQIHKNYK